MSSVVEKSLPAWCILVVDDSPDERAEVRRMLLKGCDRRLTFIEADTAKAAIDAVRAAVVLPDCMVLDYNLPDMNAPEVLEAVKGPDGMPVCPVVVVTGGISRDNGRRVLRAGAQDYIGKEWTSPQGLSRAIENACESWAMARELRQRKEAIRLVADRDAFRALFGDATRDLTDEHAFKRVASQLLGRYLGANRLIYAELMDDEHVVVEPGYASGVQQIDGVHRLANFGPALLATLRAGDILHVPDMQLDPRCSAAEKLAYADMQIVSNLAIPILKSGRLAAIVGVHQKTTRVWTHAEKFMVREIAERTWAAVEQARSEEKLLASRTQLTQVLALMPSFSAVLRGPCHTFAMANQAFYDLVQHGPEILGLPYAEALPEIANQEFPALLDKAYRTGENFEAKGMRAFVRRGSENKLAEIFVDFVYFPLREADGQVSGIFLHGVDRTEQVRGEQALRRSQQELQTLADNIPDVLSRLDRRLQFVFINAAGEKATGLRKEDFLGKTNKQIGFSEPNCQLWESAAREVFDTGIEKNIEFEFDGPQGIRHYASRVVPEFNADGHVEFVLKVTSDVTQRNHFERTLSDQDRRKDEFLATLAHELRNPLAPIRTGLQLLKISPKADEYADVAARTLPMMERQLGQLVRLIDDLLDVSRINSGKIVLKRERISLQDIAAVALEASQPMIDAAHHMLATDWPAEPVWLDADPARIAQIFSNLLTNSAKYTRAGGHIRFSAVLRGQSVVISVQDTGMGIPADMLGSVFEMFTQVNRTLDRAQGGLGIGLSLVKTLVGMHDGVIEVTSSGIDQGTTFTVILPTASSPLPEPQPALSQPAKGVTPACHRIMVVDDNVDAAESLVMLLDLSGHDVRAAFGGQEALDVAMTFRPEVVFLDIGLPSMDGYEVARQLLAAPDTASAKLIALTGWGSEQDIQKSKKAGFHAHLTKPVDPETIEALLATFLPT